MMLGKKADKVEFNRFELKVSIVDIELRRSRT